MNGSFFASLHASMHYYRLVSLTLTPPEFHIANVAPTLTVDERARLLQEALALDPLPLQLYPGPLRLCRYLELLPRVRPSPSFPTAQKRLTRSTHTSHPASSWVRM